ncbi:hypothetical protein LTR17_014329 [Elasticomyces elasticus]|nr:hypothetical protein LTR17_014329 [Elasticomyces elasticus]
MPIAQVLVLALCRFCQPFALGATLVYLPEYVEVLGTQPTEVALAASLITATFALCEAIAAIPWAALSDVVGRKPVILGTLVLAMLANVGFGFSTTLWQAVLCTGVAGITSGNVAVLRTAMTEAVPEPGHQAQAFAALPAAAGVGFILGPVLGGYSTHAAKQLEPSNLFRRYPFALPNLCTAAPFLLGATVAFGLLVETRSRTNTGWYRPLLDQDPNSMPKPTDGAEMTERSRSEEPIPLGLLNDTHEASESSKDAIDIPMPSEPHKAAAFLQYLHDAFANAFRHLGNATVWSFTLITMSSSGYDNLIPIFLHYANPSRSEKDLTASMGLGKDTKTVGVLLTSYGLIGFVATLFISPIVCKLWRPSRVLRGCALALPALYSAFALAMGFLGGGTAREVASYSCMMAKMCLSVSAMQSCLVVMPRTVGAEQLASLHGLNAMLAAVAKAVGAVVGGVAFSLSAHHSWASGPWWTLAVVAGLAIFPASAVERMVL